MKFFYYVKFAVQRVLTTTPVGVAFTLPTTEMLLGRNFLV